MTISSATHKSGNLSLKLLPFSNRSVVLKAFSGLINLVPQTLYLKADVNNQNFEEDIFESTCVYTARDDTSSNPNGLPELVSPHPRSEMHSAALKLQKVYKSYRTRRNLADCAVVVEELWWKALDFAMLNHSSVSFFNDDKPETAVSRWARAKTRAAKVGKGLSKSDKAKKLALQHWLEAIDPRHRYGHNLHFYYDVWFKSESTQPFFYWLDVGDGNAVNLGKCPRVNLQQQCIKYLGPKERETYEVIIKNGKLLYKQAESAVHTPDSAKWIFILSTYKTLYVGQKRKGKFHHSSFLAGGAITAAGRLIVKDGSPKVIWPYSGHYLPTEENFKEFINFLEENNVDLTYVKVYSVNYEERSLSFKKSNREQTLEEILLEKAAENDQTLAACDELSEAEHADEDFKEISKPEIDNENAVGKLPLIGYTKPLSRRWTTCAGLRISCIREYPSELQCEALENINLSSKVISLSWGKDPIPSPRPSPNMRLSPRMAFMGIPSPKITFTPPKPKNK